MAYGDIYNVGTISVSAGGTTVTGVGTTWQDGPNPMLRGDLFDAAGRQHRILSVDSNTSITLAAPFSGSTQSGVAYAIYMESVDRNTPAAAIQRLNGYLDGIARLKDAVDIWKCVEVGLNTQPVSPSEGDLYVVGTAPSGEWGGLERPRERVCQAPVLWLEVHRSQPGRRCRGHERRHSLVLQLGQRVD